MYSSEMHAVSGTPIRRVPARLYGARPTVHVLYKVALFKVICIFINASFKSELRGALRGAAARAPRPRGHREAIRIHVQFCLDLR